MAKNKISLNFDEFNLLGEKFDRIGGDVKSAANKALIYARDTIAENATVNMARHRRTGKTAASILKTNAVRWEGTKATIATGFDLNNGGFPSIFLMYGTPRMKKDRTLYNSVKGAAIKKKIKEKQMQIFEELIADKMG